MSSLGWPIKDAWNEWVLLVCSEDSGEKRIERKKEKNAKKKRKKERKKKENIWKKYFV